MENEYDYEVASAREWLGLDQDEPSTIGEIVWTVIELLGICAFVVGGCMLAGIKCGVI